MSPISHTIVQLGQTTPIVADAAIGIAAILLLTVLTSFAKFTMITGAVSYGLGAPRLPSAGIGAAIALLLSCVVMWPVWNSCSAAYQSAGGSEAGMRAACVPLEKFLAANSTEQARASFEKARAAIAAKANAADGAANLTPVERTLTVSGPAFMVTELTEAFMSALFVLIPFLIIDLVVMNLLVVLGAPSMKPNAVALPLKLLTFVLMDGWALIINGVVLGYSY